MKISAIITTRNRSALLREAIESVLCQEPCGAEVELIVVDDASTDNTPAVVASYPTAKYLRTQQGTAAGSRNVGIDHAEGDWMAFLDDDDVWLPHKLRRCVETMTAHPQARFLFSAATICDASLRPGTIWTGPNLTPDRSAYDAFLDDVLSCSVIVLHRDVFVKIGAFDVSVPRAEDRDFYYRTVTSGFECASIPEPLVLYRLRPENGGELTYRSYRDTMTVLRRYFARGATRRPPWKRRQQVLWRTRGWYAHQLMQASRQAHQSNEPRLGRHYRMLGLAISPLHALRTWLKPSEPA